MPLIRRFLASLALASVVLSSSVQLNTPLDTICVDEASTDCYPAQFEPTNEYRLIREGQHIPQGLDIQVDWQTGEKFAKLSDSEGSEKFRELIEVEDKRKVVNYSDDDVEEDSEIIAMKKAYGSHSTLNVKDSLDLLLSYEDEPKLLEGLESLTEHSHNLNDGILISEPLYLEKLLELIDGGDPKLKELSLRIIAQSLRHNEDALANVDLDLVFPKVIQVLKSERDPVLQKRTLGVISSLIQNEEGSTKFLDLGGDGVLLDNLKHFKEDSQIRSLEILEDLKARLTKRDNSYDLKLFKILQEALKNGDIEGEHSVSYAFDRLTELKQENKDFKTDTGFLEWLANIVTSKSLIKRDGKGEVEDDSLHRKLLEARHLVFGNPNALRKAFDDEL
jgi:nucleotide exchange factor SIL1